MLSFLLALASQIICFAFSLGKIDYVIKQEALGPYVSKTLD